MKRLLLTLALIAFTLPAFARDRNVTLWEGSTICRSSGQITVFAMAGRPFGGYGERCGKLAHDTRAVQVGEPDHGVIQVHTPEQPKDNWFTLAASVKE